MTASIWKPNGFSPEVVPFATYEGYATSGQTDIDITPYTALLDTQLQVFVAGELQNTDKWSISGTNVVLVTPMTLGQPFRVDVYAAAPVVDEELPAQTGHAGEVLKTDGTNPYWEGLQASEIEVNPVIGIYPLATNVQEVLEAAAAQVGGGFIFPPLYGAVGNGINDDTAALQNCQALGKKIGYGDSTLNYRITDSIIVENDSTHYGGGARIFQDSFQKPIFNCDGKSNVTISHLQLTGKQMVTTSAGSLVPGRAYSIISLGTTDFTLVGAASNTVGLPFVATGLGAGSGTVSTFYNTPNSQDIGVKAANATNILVQHNIFYNFGYSPLMVTLGGNNIKFLHNKVRGPGSAVLNPLALPDPQTPGFRNCTGVTIVDTVGVEIAHNEIYDTSHGIYVGQECDGFSVHHNRVLNTIVEHGMYCDAGCRNGSITNNNFFNCKLIGYKVQWYDLISTVPENIIIANNTLDGCGGDGIIFINTIINPVANLTGVTNANPAVFTTSAAHGLTVGKKIQISGVLGMTTVNSAYYVNSTPTATTFTVRTAGGVIDSTNVANYPPYVSGGQVSTPIFAKNCIIQGNTVRNAGQEAIAMRYVDGGLIQGNTIDGSVRKGIDNLFSLNVDITENLIRNTQYQGIYAYSPYDEIFIYDNTLFNVCAAGDDTSGGSSGIFFEGDGGGVVDNNVVVGESTRTKLLIGIQHGSGDKTQWTITRNRVYDAETTVVSLFTGSNAQYRGVSDNRGTTAAGDDSYSGLPNAYPNAGNPTTDYWGTAAPTTGFWQQGKKLHFQFPLDAGPTEVINQASGTPGVWHPAGMVHKVAATVPLQADFTLVCTAAVGVTGGVAGVVAGTNFYSVYGGQCNVVGWFTANITAFPSNVNITFDLPIAATLGANDTSLLGLVNAQSINTTATGGITHISPANSARFNIYCAAGAAGVIRFWYQYTYKL